MFNCYLAGAGMLVRLPLERLKLHLLEDRYRKPWMRDWEIRIVADVLRRHRPRRCLEWGSGYSTLRFPRHLPEGSTWLSVEHDRQWSDHVRGMVDRPGTSVVHVPPERFPWTDEFQDGGYDDLRSYIDYPAGTGDVYDLILVDGRGRVECLRAASDLLSEGGIVLLHDAQREHFHRGFAPYEHQELLTDETLPCGLWFGSHSEVSLGRLPMRGYERFWRFSTGLESRLVRPAERVLMERSLEAIRGG